MPRLPVRTLLGHIRGLVGARLDDRTDRELMHSFLGRREEWAFAALLQRHAPLVWGVCRRTLGQEQDAEDAFQAAFLLLAQKAPSIRNTETVGGWLHGVACRMAMNAKRSRIRRQRHEVHAAQLVQEQSTRLQPAEAVLREMQVLLDEEVGRLPAKYRAPFVLCCLEGRSRVEAARELGWKEGTVSSRLAQARERLRQRLVRRGLTLSAALTAVELWNQPASAALIQATQKAAALVAASQTVSAATTPAVATLVNTAPGTVAVKIKLAGFLVLLGIIGGTLRLANRERLAATSQQSKSEAKQDAPLPKHDGGKVRTDSHGDPLPEGAIARLGTLRWRARGEVQTISFTPDGKTIAAPSHRGLCLFDVATGKLTQHIRPPDTHIIDIVYSPGGARFAYRCSLREEDRAKGIIRHHEVVQIWEAKGPRKLREVDAEQVQWLDWSGDDQLLAASREEGAILLHEIFSGQVRRLKAKDLPPAVQGIYYCTHSPAGKLFAAPGESNKVHVWDTATGEERRALQAKGDYIRGVALSPDGRLLASYSRRDGPVRDSIELWDMTTGRVIHTVAGDQKYLDTVAFSPDGKSLATVGWNDIRFFDVASGRERSRAQGVANFGQRVAFAPDSKTLATTERFSGTIHLWDVDSGRLKPEPAGHTHRPYVAVFSPDGRRVATKAADDATIIFWDPTTGKQLTRVNRLLSWSLSRACCFSPDGDTLCLYSADNKLVFLDATSGRERRVVTLNDPEPPKHREWEYMDLSSDGKTFIALSSDQGQRRGGPLVVTGWDAVTGKQLFRRKRGPVDFGVVMSPDARVLAAAIGSGGEGMKEPGGKGPIQVEELATGKQLLTLPVLKEQTRPIDFSSDGRLLITNTWGPVPPGLVAPDSGRQMNALRLWETSSGAELLVLPSEINARVAFSRDGGVLAFSGPVQDVRLWDLRRGKEVRRLTGFAADVTSLAFSPDGSRLVSGLSDSTLLVWDVAEIQALRKTVGLSEKEAMRAWNDLAGDAKTAFAARGALADSPERTVALFKRVLMPARPAKVERLRQLLADLDSAVFATRDAAQKELAAIGELAAPALNKALRGEPTPEARRRIQALLDKLQGPVTQPEELRALRAVAVLEEIATRDAQQLLQKLAEGAPDARLTREAKAALQRLAQRGTPCLDPGGE
jgi:RNA polymerase sigma factor (sigma-70 family)